MSTRIEVTQDIATCLELRRIVFIDEQGVPEADERDDLDAKAVHLLAWVDGKPVGSARLLAAGHIGKNRAGLRVAGSTWHRPWRCDHRHSGGGVSTHAGR